MDDHNNTRRIQLLKRSASDHLVSYPIETQQSLDIQQSSPDPQPSRVSKMIARVSPSELGVLQWVHDRWAANRWFHLTVRFNMFKLCHPMWERCHEIYDGYVHAKLAKLVGFKSPIYTFMREYERAPVRNGYCHHIHSLIGVRKSGNFERLVRNVRQAIVGSGKRQIHGVQLDELPTLTDVEGAYSYIRKNKWHEDPFA
jgi:hypothetical protein